MEELPVRENVGKKPALFRSRLKIVALALLMLGALAASGIFISSAHASGSGEPTGDAIKLINGCQIVKDDGKGGVSIVVKGNKLPVLPPIIDGGKGNKLPVPPPIIDGGKGSKLPVPPPIIAGGKDCKLPVPPPITDGGKGCKLPVLPPIINGGKSGKLPVPPPIIDGGKGVPIPVQPSTKGDGLQGTAVAGSITALKGTTFVINKNSTVKITAQTKFIDLTTGKDVTLSDLKVGDFVVAKGTLNSDGSINALGVGIGVAPVQPKC